MTNLLTQEQEAEADRLAGAHATLRDRAVAAGYGNNLSDEDVAELRTEMAVLSSQYFDLTGEALE
ncbi:MULTISPECIES: hypothetical protein [Pseudomonas]|uniref:hypothetical protein n=1 Tax=Pseudomonas TaxID=286 RepID=UPI00070A423F|nr:MULTISPECIES: hypothetical protein [Pseudomonas]KQW19791.1 hypothetical protein ASC85_08045 [Pseudomonas sp. Root401]PWD01975.1 hypothetical protein CX658_18640 [Pseudomonas amygdali pv. lachrymans]WHS57373.1 hypothetical protein QLH64_30615 [Pseudomonas brassicacearum]WNZ87546.1 hypothetical protein QOM10_30130 [Pseudomonas sp. P108]